MIKTIVIVLILLPLIAHALKKLYLYVVDFQANKCSGCPHADQSFKQPACGSCVVSKPQKKINI
ncbi:MAG: hypothetical protein ACRCY4_04405 [Brevinema sp.]